MYNLFFVLIFIQHVSACTDFVMNFTKPELKLSVRTLDLGMLGNWTLTSWPRDSASTVSIPGFESITWESKYGVLGISGNWFGDDSYGFPALYRSPHEFSLSHHRY